MIWYNIDTEKKYMVNYMQLGLFDIDDCYSRLDKAGDPLMSLSKTIDWSGLAGLMETVKF